MKKETKEKIKERILPKKIKWKRVLVLGAILLVVILLLQVVAASGLNTRSGTTHYLRIYDAEGRYLNPSVPAVKQYLHVQIYRTDKSTIIKDAKGVNNISFQSDEGYAWIKIFWVNASSAIYANMISLANTYVNLSLPYNPAKPIVSWQSEALSISASGKSISSPFYGVTFGAGDHRNVIQLSIASKTWNMPVTFDASTSNSSSNNLPFQFLAEQPGKSGMVSGEYNTGFLWLDHVKYASAYNSTLINGNTFIIVWVYAYYVNYDRHDFVTDVVGGALMGAIVGSFVPGVGTAAGSLVGAVSSAIGWAIHKYLFGSNAIAYLGVVAAIFTPRYLLIQAVTGKSNLDGATTNMNNLPSAGRHAENTISYEVLVGDKQLQIGFTRYWYTWRSDYTDFEDGTADGWTLTNMSVSSAQAHSGQYSIKTVGGGDWTAVKDFSNFVLKNGSQYSVTFSLWDYKDNSNFAVYWHLVDAAGHQYASGKYYDPNVVNSWEYNTTTVHITAIENSTLELRLNPAVSSSDTGLWIDDIQVSYAPDSEYRTIFTNSASNPVVGYFPPGSGEIPVIMPADNGFSQTIMSRYTLIAIKKMNNTNGVLGLDWASREPVMCPARVAFSGGGENARATGWSVSVWLIGTDDKDGFKGVNFTYVTQNYVWTPDFGYNPVWSNNWTIVTEFTSLAANGSMIIVPQFIKDVFGGAGVGTGIDWGNILKWTAIGIFALLILAIIVKTAGGRVKKLIIRRRKR